MTSAGRLRSSWSQTRQDQRPLRRGAAIAFREQVSPHPEQRADYPLFAGQLTGATRQ
jgi:hypothetical protein